MNKKLDNVSLVTLKSNIMLKKRYLEHYILYLPVELLPSDYKDARTYHDLSPLQQKELVKSLFHAKRIVDVIDIDEDE
jgi:hypothetical protein